MSLSRSDDRTTTASLSPAGLSAAEVALRVREGRVNTLPPKSGRSVADIVRANVFTRINLILGLLFAVVASTGSWKNGLFGLLIVANSGIGIVQEWRAKRTLDSLAILGQARPRVRRDGAVVEIGQQELVEDDVVEISSGDQILVDGEVLASVSLDVDESLLTGEMDPLHKRPGDTVRSGSFVSSGSGEYRATAVGADSYASKITAEARTLSLTDSELRRGIDRILGYIGFLLVPTAILIVVTQLVRSGAGLRSALLGMVAALVPMVPEGLVLMTSIAFAVGVVRLGRRRCLVQELPAIEALARVDTVCTDKTGTLTENGMRLSAIHLEPAASETDVRQALAQLAATDPRPNQSMRAIAEEVGIPRDPWTASAVAPFTSATKWSGASFGENGSLVLGAPEMLLPPGDDTLVRAGELAATGLRVLLVASASAQVDTGDAPGIITALALVTLEQRIRPDAASTVDFFHQQGVAVKVISGDNAVSVGAVTADLDLDGDGDPATGPVPVDARALPSEDAAFAEAVEEAVVFGRVTPEQKQHMVTALRDQGHAVAMTGDGVNDVLALKSADVGVAMGTGSQAARAVAQIVLLDDRFASLPHVVAEGRRVIGNIERVATLFLVKTVYSAILALLVGLSGLAFPFQPIHVTITAWFTIGIPAFLLSLAPNHERARSGFVRRVIWHALPAGAIIGLATFTTYAVLSGSVDAGRATATQVSTAALVVIISGALWVLAKVARPWQPWKIALIVVGAATYVVMFTTPVLARFFELDPWNTHTMMVAALATAITVAVIEIAALVERRVVSTRRD